MTNELPERACRAKRGRDAAANASAAHDICRGLRAIEADIRAGRLGEAEAPLVLRRSKRSAHARSYVVALCREAGFGRCTVEPLELRLEANVPVAGFIAVAEKS